MPAVTAAVTGIHNENEFYSHHYLSEIFSGDITHGLGRVGQRFGIGAEQRSEVVRSADGT